MTLFILAMVAGIAVLVWSADRFVEGAASLARRLGVSQLVIGMVVVGFGTSMPEMLVSVLAAWEGAPGVAIGNAYGSNTANITLILGVAALARPIPVNAAIVRREIPILLCVTAIAAFQIWQGMVVSRSDALVLLFVFFIIMYLSVIRGGKAPEAVEAEERSEAAETMPARRAAFWVVAGLALLMAGSRALVWGAVGVARLAGVNDLAIGLTIVAVGTSLPELASSVSAALKNRHDIAVGNVIGSNLFNTLAVVGAAALVKPIPVEPVVLWRDLNAVAVCTLLLLVVCAGKRGEKGRITRGEGGLLVATFVLYTLWVLFTS